MTDHRDAASIEILWRRMAERPGLENRELDLGLQVPLVVGCTADKRPYIMVLTDERPEPLTGLEAIDVQVGSRTSPIGEDWSLTFILRDWGLLHAFAEICLLFAERIRSASSKKGALREIYSTVDQWRRLLRTIGRTDRLSVLRGACGELLAALEIARLTARPVDTVLQWWTGPYGAPQDYSCDADHRYWEVKTIHASTRRIPISSPEQLDISDRRITVVTVTLDTPADGKTEGLVSLSRIAERLRRAAGDPYLAGRCIDDGLDMLGLDPYSDPAMHTMFALGPVAVYDVRDGFPRIVPAMLPDGVSDLTYAVELDAIERFAVAVDALSIGTEE